MSEVENIRALLVEDDDEDAAIFCRYGRRLTGYALDVTHARDAEEAKSLLADDRFDLIFLDLELGELGSGMHLLWCLRDQELDTPVIVVTGAGDEARAVEAMKGGAHDYLVKVDLGPGPLERSIRYVRNRHFLEQEHAQMVRRLAERTEELSKANQALKAEVSERKRAEEALRNAELLKTSILDAQTEHVILQDASLRILWPNAAACESAGATREEMVGRHWYEIWQQRTDPCPECPVRKAIESGQPQETEMIMPDGRSWFIRGYPVRNARGDVVGAVEVARDITERKRLDARMQQAQKLESLGVLAGGVAHDFNNLLTGVLGNAGLALMDLPCESPARESIQRIEESARSAAELASQMLAYSGRGQFVIESLNLSNLVREMQQLLKSIVSKKVILKWELADDLPPVEGDAAQFRQVIMNLAINASEAIGDEDGVITVRTGTIRVDRAYLSGTYLAEDLPEGPYVCLEVSDTGSGMDAETKHKVFDPFFSTKFTGRGLGLAAVLGIVRGHRGAIKVYSEPGSGSAFKVLLPSSEGVIVGGREPSEVPTTEWHGSGTILVVDDEEVVQTVTSTVLKAYGFSVLTAKSGREAIEVMEDSPPEIAAVLLDLTMPGMSAEDVFTELRRIRQDVPIILSSGYTEQDAVSRLAGKDLAGFIQKPYEPAKLLAKLREVLEGPDVYAPPA